MFGMKRSSVDNNVKNVSDPGPRFIEKERHFIGGCKEIVVLVDTHTEIQYMTTTSPKSGVLMMYDTLGKPLVSNKPSAKRFFEKNRQLIAGCKGVIVFVDKLTGVQYLTTTAPNSDVIMLRDNDENPLFED